MNDKLRTFIAIELSSEIRQAICDFAASIQENPSTGFRWVKAENLHLTLKFLGDLPTDKLLTIRNILDKVCEDETPFDLQMNQTGAFPSWQHPRNFWIGIDPSLELGELYQKLDIALTKNGIPSDGKKFSPHLTMCRISDTCDPKVLQQVTKVFMSIPIRGAQKWNVEKIVFFKSQLNPSGPVYSVLSEHHFLIDHKV